MLYAFHQGEDYPCPKGCPGSCVQNCVKEVFELGIDDAGAYHPRGERYVRDGKEHCCGKPVAHGVCRVCGSRE